MQMGWVASSKEGMECDWAYAVYLHYPEELQAEDMVTNAFKKLMLVPMMQNCPHYLLIS